MKRFNRKLRAAQEDTDGEKKKSRIIFLSICAVVMIGAGIMFAFFYIRPVCFDTYEVVYSVDTSLDSGVRYAACNGGYLTYDCDGVKAVSAEGTQLWNAAYNYKNPIISTCGPYTAVADKGNNEFCVVDKNSSVSHYNVTGKISDISVASQGVTAVLVTESEQDHVYLYDFSGKTILVDIMTKTKMSGFPVKIALSPDGRKLVTSYLAFENGDICSWVTFYNFGDVGQNQVDNMVGSYSFAAVVPEVRFLTNDRVLVCRDNGIEMFEMTEIPKTLVTEDFSDEIKSVFSDAETTGVVIMSEKQEDRDRILLYDNRTGKKIGSIALDCAHGSIGISGADIICSEGTDLTILDKSGRVKFHGVFSQNLRRVFPTNKSAKYILVGNQSTDTIELKRTKKVK